MSQLYRIPVEKFELLQMELNRINKRSEKCGTAGFELAIHGTEVVPVGNGQVRVFYTASIEGDAPKISGYTFIARLDHNTDPTGASNLVYSTPGTTLTPEQRSLPALCEHCGWKRARRDTYLLREDSTGKVIQVGRACVKDFIGHDPEKILKYAGLLMKAIEGAESASHDGYNGMTDWRTVDLKHYLKYVSLAIRKWGWVSSREAYSTGKEATRDDAWTVMVDNNRFWSQQGIVPTDEDTKNAEDALEWALKQDKTSSDYMHNLVTLAETGYIDGKSAGVAASIIQAYNKAMERETSNKIDTSKSSHVGKKGDRLTLEVTVYGKSYGSGSYGPWTRVSMIDSTGNVYVTFAGGKFDPQNNAKIKIRGTVKNHSEFKGTRQTNLNRVMEIV